MSLVIVVGGPAGTGKTTTAEMLSHSFGDCPFVEGDTLHPQANIDKMSHGIPLTDDDRWGWLKELSQTTARKSEEAHSKITIASCSILKKSYRDYIKANAKGFGPELKFRFVFLHTSYEELLKRVAGRSGHYMKSDMVKSQYDIMEIPQGDELTTNGGDAIAVDATGKDPQQVLDAVLASLKEDSRLNL